ncbi:MAG: peptide ABC transporter substrate-binding protein [Anaerolineales bacterium]
MRSLKFVLFAVLSLALILAACTPAATPTSEPAKPEATQAPDQPAATEAPTVDPNVPVKGGTVIVGTAQEPGTLSPLLASATIDDVVGAFIVEGLIGTDVNGAYIPVLAEELPTISDDGLVVTYKIKQGIKFNNGDPLTCADVQYTYDAIMSDLSGASTSGYSDIDKIECTDDYTAVVYFAEPYAPYLRLFSYIVPRAAGDLAKMDTWEYNRAPIGTGPWMVKNWSAGDFIELVPNPYYREEGKPYLDSVIVKIVPSREVGMQLLGTGAITVLWDLTEADFPTLDKMPGVTWAGALYGSGENELLVFNFGTPDGSAPADPAEAPHPILSDLRVRQAIQYAIDKQLIVDTLLYGNVKVGTTVLPTGTFACPQPPSEYNVEKAKTLLEEAGWVVGNDGIRTKDGMRMSLKISTTSGNQLREQTEQVLVEMLKEVGIELVIDNVPSDVLFASWDSDGMRKKGRFDILLYTTGAGIDPDSHLFSNYHSARIPSAENNGAGNNFSRYINADVDAWIDEAATNPNLDVRREAYCNVAAQINKDLPRVFLYERLVIAGYRENLQNFQVSSGWSDITIDSQNWWLKP